MLSFIVILRARRGGRLLLGEFSVLPIPSLKAGGSMECYYLSFSLVAQAHLHSHLKGLARLGVSDSKGDIYIFKNILKIYEKKPQKT